MAMRGSALFLSILVILTLRPISVSPSQNNAPNSPSPPSSAILSTNVSIDEAFSLAQGHDLSIAMLESHFDIAGTELTDFYTPTPSDTAETALTAFVQSRRDLLHNLAQSLQQDVSLLSNTEASYLNKDSLKDAVAASRSVRVTAITVSGDSASINNVAQQNGVHGVRTREQQDGKVETTASAAPVINQAETAAASDQWYPDFGVSFIGECQPGEAAPCQASQRYALQLMHWDANRFKSDQAYEHELFLYNYDGKTYLDNGTATYPGCFPEATYAATSWPSDSKPYVDTRLRDSLTGCFTEELEFTIGAARAVLIPSDTMQFTYFQTGKGNTDRGKFKVQGQLGYHLIKDCDNLWCVNGVQSIPIEKYIPAWSDLVPGRLEWSAPSTNRSIGGIVRDYTTGNPVADATVTAEGAGKKLTTTTDSVGYYVFSEVPQGKYKIVATKAGVGEGTNEAIVFGNDAVLLNIALAQARGQDYAIIIDSSGSMLTTDPARLRVQAASLFVQSLETTSRVTVIDFDGSSRVVWPLQEVGNNRQKIITAINQYINSSGSTNISGGLRSAYLQLNDASLQAKTAILLTDGQQDGSSYDPQWEQAFATKKWPVYTFGLSRAADAVLLQRIATVTGGDYTFLATADQLTGLYNKLRTRLSGARQLLDTGVVMKTGDTQKMSVGLFQSTSRAVNFTVTWPGSRVDTVLRDPDGRVITPDTQDPDVIHRKGDTYEIYTVLYPKTGFWEITARGVQLASAGELVSFQVDSTATLHTVVVPLLQKPGISPQLSAPPTPPITPISTLIPLPSPNPLPTPTATSTLIPTPNPATILRIEAGADTTYTDQIGNAWEGDRGFIGGNIVDRGNIPISGTNDPRLYRTERWGMSGYVLPVVNGTYTVRLHFAETSPGIDQIGERVFGVSVEGVSLGNIDIVAQTGGQDIALVKAVNVVVTDGQLHIGFTKVTENPEINAIEVIPTRQTALRIEAGSSASYQDAAGNIWVADMGFVGGDIVDRGAIPIANTADSRLYHTERWGMSEYVLPVTNGAYTIQLHFAETSPGIDMPGERVFAVSVEGNPLGTIDIVAETGGQRTALVKTVNVVVTDGHLNIGFTRVTENPEINAIEVLPN